MNDKFVKCVADFISNAWYKRQHALFNYHTLYCFAFYYYYYFSSLYCTFVYIMYVSD